MLYLQPARFADLGARELLASPAGDGEEEGIKRMNTWFQGWARGHAETALGEVEGWLAEHGGFGEEGKLGLGDVSCWQGDGADTSS